MAHPLADDLHVTLDQMGGCIEDGLGENLLRVRWDLTPDLAVMEKVCRRCGRQTRYSLEQTGHITLTPSLLRSELSLDQFMALMKEHGISLRDGQGTTTMMDESKIARPKRGRPRKVLA